MGGSYFQRGGGCVALAMQPGWFESSDVLKVRCGIGVCLGMQERCCCDCCGWMSVVFGVLKVVAGASRLLWKSFNAFKPSGQGLRVTKAEFLVEFWTQVRFCEFSNESSRSGWFCSPHGFVSWGPWVKATDRLNLPRLTAGRSSIDAAFCGFLTAGASA